MGFKEAMGAVVSLSIVAAASAYVWSTVKERDDRREFLRLRSNSQRALDAANPGAGTTGNSAPAK